MTYVVILLVMMVAFTVVGWPLMSSGRDAPREHGGGSPLGRLIGRGGAACRGRRPRGGAGRRRGRGRWGVGGRSCSSDGKRPHGFDRGRTVLPVLREGD